MSEQITVEAGSALVRIDGLRKTFTRPGEEELIVIEDASFSVEEQQFIAVVGPSGCGKTTLLRIIAGMTQPSGGSVELNGGRLDRRSIGYVFQFASLYPWRTVQRNVMFGLELRARNGHRGAGRRAARAKADELIKLVGLDGFGHYYPGAISGGMQQRANLARALAISPELLLMDEPFSALDAQTREDLQIELQRIAVEAGSTVVFITHDIREAVYLADRVVVLSPRPSRVVDVIDVPTPRPRPFEYEVSDEFNEIVRRIWALVHRIDPTGNVELPATTSPPTAAQPADPMPSTSA